MPMTCVACRVSFITNGLQRDHYKTDWHRYNLKRRVAQLLPVSLDEFNERVTMVAASGVANQTSGMVEKPSDSIHLVCIICSGKKFASQNSYENHVRSKKHIENEEGAMRRAYMEAEVEVAKRREKESMDNTEEKDAYNNALAQAVNKLSFVTVKDTRHVEDVVDVDAEDSDGSWEDCSDEEDDDSAIPPTRCLFCTEASADIASNCVHMSRVHGFYVPDPEFLVDLEGILVFLGYKLGVGRECPWCGRTFRSVQAVRTHCRDKQHARVRYDAKSCLNYADFYDYTDETEGSSSDDIKPTDDGFHLILPSGSTIAHRELARYYKQNLPPRSGDNSHRVASQKPLIATLVKRYRALGWGASGPTEVSMRRWRRDMMAVRRYTAKQQLRVQVGANKLQKFMRPQYGF